MGGEWPMAPLSELTDPDTPVTYGGVKPGPEDPAGVLSMRGGATADGRALTARLPPGVEIEPHQLLVSLGPVVSDPIDSIDVEQRGPSAATVVVEQAGQRHRVDLVREDGAWRIDLELPLDRI